MTISNPTIYIDRKQNLSELTTNVGKDHARFMREIKLAKELGLKLVILCEHGYSIKTLDDVKSWDNPRLRTHPKAMTGETLHKILSTMLEKNDHLSIQFCNKSNTGKEILKILNLGVDK